MKHLFPTLVFLAAATSATAQVVPTLKADVTVSGEFVRIGDLVDNAGDKASVAVFRAPDPGSTGTVSVDRVLEALRPHAVIGMDTKGLTGVSVTRTSRTITRAQIEARIAREATIQLGLRDPKNVGVIFDQEPQPIEVDSGSTGELKTERLSFDRRTGRFNIIILLPGEHRNWRYAGFAGEVFEAATPTRPVARGEILRAGDISIEKRPKAELTGDVVADAKAVIGQAARHALRPGQPLRQGDLMRAELVQRNEPVTILYQVPGIVLTLRGKAMDSGAEGDVINVLNIQSKRTVQGVVTGDGRVLVSPAARVASVLPSESGAQDR